MFLPAGHSNRVKNKLHFYSAQRRTLMWALQLGAFWLKSEMIRGWVNKVDSLTEYEHCSPCSAFESQSDTAPTYQIAQELLSITGFCLLNSKTWWSLLTFFLFTSQKMKGNKIWQLFSLEAGRGERKNRKENPYCLPVSRDMWGITIHLSFKTPFQGINCMWQCNFAWSHLLNVLILVIIYWNLPTINHSGF